jgi:hyperpolarization activated cyclic nucleotide-gated potassium channel 2
VAAHIEEEHEKHPDREAEAGGRDSILFDDIITQAKLAKDQQFVEDTRCLIMPGSRGLTIWRFLMVYVVLWACMAAPFELAFSWWEPGIWYKVISVMVDVFCITDMMLNFVIASVKTGRLVTKKSAIAKSYLKHWFVLDLLTNMPWDVLLHSAGKSRKVVKILKLPKVLRLTRLLRVAREEAHTLGTLFTLCGLIILAHYMSCMWVTMLIDCGDGSEVGRPCPEIGTAYTEGLAVGMSALSGSDSWLRFMIETGPAETGGSFVSASGFVWDDTYVSVELTAAANSLIGMVACGILFANIARAMDKQDAHTRLFNERLLNVKEACHQHEMKKEIYNRARKHFHYVWSCGSDASRALLEDRTLSVDLRRELAFSFYGDLLRKVPFLEPAEDLLLKQLCRYAQMEVFSPKDKILLAGEVGDQLFFLVSGTVDVFSPQGYHLRTLEEGSFFGEMALFFEETCHNVNVVAASFGWLLIVGREILQDLCSEDLLEAFRTVAIERYTQEEDHDDESITEEMLRTAVVPGKHGSESSLDEPRSPRSEGQEDGTAVGGVGDDMRVSTVPEGDAGEEKERLSCVSEFGHASNSQEKRLSGSSQGATGSPKKKAGRFGKVKDMPWLRVQIIGARSLRNADILGRSDPYTECFIPGRPGTKYTTEVQWNTLNPTWNERHEIHHYTAGLPLRFEVYDKDDWPGTDDFLGAVELKSPDFYPNGFDGEIELKDESRPLEAQAFLRIKIDVMGLSSEARAAIQSPGSDGTTSTPAETSFGPVSSAASTGSANILEIPIGKDSGQSNLQRGSSASTAQSPEARSMVRSSSLSSNDSSMAAMDSMKTNAPLRTESELQFDFDFDGRIKPRSSSSFLGRRSSGTAGTLKNGPLTRSTSQTAVIMAIEARLVARLEQWSERLDKRICTWEAGEPQPAVLPPPPAPISPPLPLRSDVRSSSFGPRSLVSPSSSFGLGGAIAPHQFPSSVHSSLSMNSKSSTQPDSVITASMVTNAPSTFLAAASPQAPGDDATLPTSPGMLPQRTPEESESNQRQPTRTATR